MSIRYFVSTDSENRPLALYRFDISIHDERCWNGAEWVYTEKPTRFLILGEGWLEEVDEQTAKKSFPEAFQESSK